MSITKMDGSASMGTTPFYLASNSTTKTDQTDDCELDGWIDFSTMTAGDQYRVRILEKVNAGTQRDAVPPMFVTGVQPSLYVLPRLIVTDGWEVEVTKITGTDRTNAWSLRKLWPDGQVDVGKWLGSTVNVLVSGRVDASVGAMAANVITAAATAADFGAELADAIWDEVVEGTQTARQWIRLARARLWGKATVPSGDGSYAYRDQADTKNRIAGTVTATARAVTTEDGT